MKSGGKAPDSVLSGMLRELWKEALALPGDRQTLRRFGLVVGGVFLAIGVLLSWRADWTLSTGAQLTGVVGGLLVVAGGLFPRGLEQIYPAWMLVALVLGTLMTRVLLTAVYFLVITPIALIFKLLGKDPMHRKPDPGAGTYWITRSPESNDRARMEKLY